MRVSFNNFNAAGLQSQLAATWNNPQGLGDRLTLGVGTSPGGSFSGSAAYSLPLDGNGWTASISYVAGDNRQSLGATPIITRSRTVGMRLSYPVKRTQLATQRLELGYDAQTEQRTIGTVLADESRIARTSVTWQSQSSLTGGGNLSYSVTAARGNLSLAPDDVPAADAASAKTAGVFARIGAGATMRGPVGTGFTLNVEFRGQLASKNLHASEKMGISGFGGVRAYGGGVAAGDQGWLIRSELQREFPSQAPGLVGHWKVLADIGRAQRNHSPWTGMGDENVVGLAGIGGGITLAWNNWTFEVINAYPIGQDPTFGDGGRLWLRATWQY